MPWYAASVVVQFEFKEGPQSPCRAYENVYVIEADNADAAMKVAIRIGGEDEGGDDERLVFDGRPARTKFRGVRKLIECSPPEAIESESEVTYSELEFEGSVMGNSSIPLRDRPAAEILVPISR